MSQVLIKADSIKEIDAGKVLTGLNEFEEEINLKNLQQAVGGPIELVHLAQGAIMIVNEEGLLHDLQVNRLASIMAGKQIVGDIVLLTEESVKLFK